MLHMFPSRSESTLPSLDQEAWPDLARQALAFKAHPE